jgi:hypothetical protein
MTLHRYPRPTALPSSLAPFSQHSPASRNSEGRNRQRPPSFAKIIALYFHTHTHTFCRNPFGLALIQIFRVPTPALRIGVTPSLSITSVQKTRRGNDKKGHHNLGLWPIKLAPIIALENQ